MLLSQPHHSFIRFLLVVVLCLVFFSCREPAQLAPKDDSLISCEEMVLNMHNSNLKWDGTYGGLSVDLSNTEQILIDQGVRCIPEIFKALDDDNRFVAAHVILTLIYSNEFRTSSKEWNGLNVSFSPQKEPIIPASQKNKIKEKWLRDERQL